MKTNERTNEPPEQSISNGKARHLFGRSPLMEFNVDSHPIRRIPNSWNVFLGITDIAVTMSNIGVELRFFSSIHQLNGDVDRRKNIVLANDETLVRHSIDQSTLSRQFIDQEQTVRHIRNALTRRTSVALTRDNSLKGNAENGNILFSTDIVFTCLIRDWLPRISSGACSAWTGSNGGLSGFKRGSNEDTWSIPRSTTSHLALLLLLQWSSSSTNPTKLGQLSPSLRRSDWSEHRDDLHFDEINSDFRFFSRWNPSQKRRAIRLVSTPNANLTIRRFGMLIFNARKRNKRPNRFVFLLSSRLSSLVRSFFKAKEEHQQAVKTALERYKTSKQARVKKLAKKTRRGQPVMKGQIELLLEKIQQQKK